MVAKRTVKVALDVDTLAARKGIRAGIADIDKLTGSVKVAGKSLDEMAEEAAQTGRKLDGMAGKAAKAERSLEEAAAATRITKAETAAYKRELGQLDRQIDATVLHLKVLGREFADTGDKSLLRKITADRRLVAQMRKVRLDLMAGTGDAAGGVLRSSASPLLVAAVAAALAPLLPTIGAAVGGAVLGGVGVGGIVGGVVAAAHDGRVKDAYADLGHGLAASMKEAGRPFLAPLLHEVDTLGAAGYSAINILRSGFASLAPVVRPLAHGLDGFVAALGPGLKEAFKAAAPALRVIANELPELGSAISDALYAISRDSDGAIEGLVGLLHAAEDLIRGGGEFIGFLSRAFEWLVRVSNASATVLAGWLETFSFLEKIPGIGTALGLVRGFVEDARDETYSLMEGMDKAKDSSNDFAFSLDGTADSADDAAEKIKNLQDKIDDLFAAQLSWDQAQIDLRQGMRDLVEELTNGARTLKENTVEGDKNRESIIRQIRVILDAAEAYRTQTGDIEGANRKRDEGLEKIRAELLHLGYNKQAVNNLIDAYKRLPAKASTQVQAPGLATTQSRLAKVEAQMNRLDGRVVHSVVATDFYSYRHDEVAASRRWGGITEHESGAVRYAAAGVLRDAAVYSVRSPARYAYAEPATGGEAFVPKRGDYDRSMGILSTAAGWYGASVVPGGYMRSPVAGPPPIFVNVTVSPAAHGHELTRALITTLRYEVAINGGDVQEVMGSRPYASQAQTAFRSR